MEWTIRRYKDPDKETVLSLYSQVTHEQIWPCFRNAMSSPLYLCFSLGLGVTGYLLASGLGALVLVSGWAGLVYYCCHKLYADNARDSLKTDMQDIPASYMAQPDDCFWVVETVATGKVVGMVAVVAKKNGAERYGELFRMIDLPATRQKGLGSRMVQTVLDFCKQRGISKVTLVTSSSLTAAISLYRKMGFKLVLSHTKTHLPDWMMKINRATYIVMEKIYSVVPFTALRIIIAPHPDKDASVVMVTLDDTAPSGTPAVRTVRSAATTGGER
ncbi:N-acetyltransferase family 8 member 7-like [Gadus chalcogrammus]|uniref:N-acetyltransferase family 8 member 7-like n=1 Tax=Gadus chalcogrammus TaxID=1042646 RepID=UPI0024C47A79|nr:N-acetyltransferase family 8 member 7-like [Gadus chalcogrammus]